MRNYQFEKNDQDLKNLLSNTILLCQQHRIQETTIQRLNQDQEVVRNLIIHFFYRVLPLRFKKSVAKKFQKFILEIKQFLQ